MTTTLFGFPVNILTSLSAAGSQAAMRPGQAAQNSYNQNQLASQAHSAQMYIQQAQALQAAQLAQKQHQWMVAGRTMTFDEFLDEVAPGADNSMRTFLILKYQK